MKPSAYRAFLERAVYEDSRREFEELQKTAKKNRESSRGTAPTRPSKRPKHIRQTKKVSPHVIDEAYERFINRPSTTKRLIEESRLKVEENKLNTENDK